MTMNKLVLGLVFSLAVAACGGKAASGPTTPSNNGGTMGNSAGSAATPATPAGSAAMPSGAGGDPCGGN